MIKIRLIGYSASVAVCSGAETVTLLNNSAGKCIELGNMARPSDPATGSAPVHLHDECDAYTPPNMGPTQVSRIIRIPKFPRN